MVVLLAKKTKNPWSRFQDSSQTETYRISTWNTFCVEALLSYVADLKENQASLFYI